jgi:hypothetical protein
MSSMSVANRVSNVGCDVIIAAGYKDNKDD